jgi:hypothetical protein
MRHAARFKSAGRPGPEGTLSRFIVISVDSNWSVGVAARWFGGWAGSPTHGARIIAYFAHGYTSP